MWTNSPRLAFRLPLSNNHIDLHKADVRLPTRITAVRCCEGRGESTCPSANRPDGLELYEEIGSGSRAWRKYQ
ncbi:hypothetical protein EYF80_000618 [Liparis tanakae]|uniref:Uncharacterized protein n=1 Tax=Liparis tanakae TaxID=230148 RepID=A0A4Z2JGQ5_9TELE|nr:hypothetical protein EYF80_000618 [Liparis tanakae]